MASRQAKSLMGYAHDVTMIALTPFVASLLRMGSLTSPGAGFLYFTVAFIGGGYVGLLLFRLNTGSWRYASVEDVTAIVKCAALASAAGTAALVLLGNLEGFPRSTVPISFGLMIGMMLGPRLAYRVFKESVLLPRAFERGAGKEAVLLYGYCDGASNLIRQVRRESNPLYRPVGIVAHRANHVGRALHDVPVVGMLGELPAIKTRMAAKGHKVGKLIIAVPKLTPAEIGAIVDAAAEVGLTTLRIPHYADFLDANAQQPVKLQTIDIEDLLGRKRVDLDLSSIARLFAGKRVLVTGAGGSIGSEICRQICAFGPSHLTLLDHGEYNMYMIDGDLAAKFPDVSRAPILCDIQDRAKLHRVMAAERPAVVFHAAALKHVPLVEHNVLAGLKTNILGTRNVADGALACGCEAMVMISTDKAVNPTNVMGASKRFAEAYCQLLDRSSTVTRFMTVRFGNVLGSAGSVVPLFTRQIAAGGPITVTHPDIERYFMTISEAVRLVLASSARGMTASTDRGRIFVLDMGQPIKIVDLARRMIQLSGLKPNVDIPIEFIGLRPGEKLFEETFAASETALPTDSHWLQVAAYRPVDPETMRRAIERIQDAVERDDAGAGVTAVKLIVPELTHSGSEEPPRQATVTRLDRHRTAGHRGV